MAEENVQKLLDMLYEMIDEAKNAPLSNDKCVLNRDEALDLLDEIRAQMPVELKRAQELANGTSVMSFLAFFRVCGGCQARRRAHDAEGGIRGQEQGL